MTKLKETVTAKADRKKLISFFAQFSNPELQEEEVVKNFFCSGICPQESIDNFSTTNVDFSGNLIKRKGDSKRKETKRFCIIKNRTLYYYKKSKDISPAGFVLLDGTFASMRQGSTSKAPKNSFSVISRKSKAAEYLFVASTSQEAQQWVDVISKANEDYSKCVTKVQGTLTISVVSATDLLLPKTNEPTEVFATIYVDRRILQTSVQDNANPKFVNSHQDVVKNKM